MPTLGRATVDLVVNSASFKTALKEAVGETRNFGREVRASSSEARGSIALLGEEVGVHLPRHLRNFVAGLPGVGAAMSAAFSTVAVVTLGVIAVKTGEKIVEAFRQAQGAPLKLREEIGAVNNSLTAENAQLDVAYDKIESSIAKLQGKPQNGIKEAIDEAVVSAINLGKKLEEDVKKIDDVLKKEGVSGWGGFITHRASTRPVEEIAAYALEQSKANEGITTRDLLNASTLPAGEQTAARQKATADAKSRDLALLDELQRRLNMVQAPQIPSGIGEHGSTTPDATALLGSKSDFQRNIDSMRLLISDTERNASAQSTLTGLQASTEYGKKAATDQLQNMEDIFKALKSQHATTLAEDAHFWADMAEDAKKYPTNLRAVTDKINDILGQMRKETQALTDSLYGKNGVPGEAQKYLDDIDEKLQRDNMSDIGRFSQALSHQVAPLARRAESNQEQAQTRVFGFDIASQDLQQQLSVIAQIRAQVGDTAGIEAAIRDIRREQLGIDAQELLQRGTALDGMKAFFKDFQLQSKTTAQEFNDVMMQSVGGVTQGLAALATGAQFSFAHLFQSIAQQMVTFGIDKMLQDLFSLGGSSSGIGGFFSGLLGVPHRAMGGDVDPGRAYWTGENGPELFMPSTSGSIVPNNRLSSMLGSDSGHMVYIDARESSNPADVELRVHRAMQSYFPGSVRASAQVALEIRRRMPLSAQR